MQTNSLYPIFNPRSFAIVGASATKGKIGYTIVENLIRSRYAERGRIFPINPNHDEILGFKAYKSVLDVPEPIDVAVITTPADTCRQVAEECGRKGVKGLAVIASGFSEVGRDDLELEILEVARRYDMRLLGPNIVGLISVSGSYNASFAPFLPFPGRVSMISQSGALLIAINSETYTKNVGMDKLVSLGNMSDVDFGDVIEYLDSDPYTHCISLYIEGFREGRKFMEKCAKAKKPIIALKAGVSRSGAAAAASHTGSLAGSGKVYGAAFKQAGVLQAANLGKLFDRALALAFQPPMRGDNLLVITNGGGVGVLAADAAEECGLPLRFAPDDLKAQLKQHMPDFGSARNPVDLTGMATRDWYEASVEVALKHPWVDGLTVLMCEVPLMETFEVAQGIYAALERIKSDKPVTLAFIGGEKSIKATKWLIEKGYPVFDAPHKAIDAMKALRDFCKLRERPPIEIGIPEGIDRGKVKDVIRRAREDGRSALTEIEAKEVFAAYGMPVAATRLAKSEEEAIALANEIGYPVVMKIVSPQIIHKSDAGGVKINIANEAEVRKAFHIITANAKAYRADAEITGIAVQEMAPRGTEVIMGSSLDSQFGPTLMFGLGGIFVEILKDVAFRIAPINEAMAGEMMAEINTYPLLQGARGEKPKDVAAMAGNIARLSHLVWDWREDIQEVDANPVMLYENGLKIVDARIILRAPGEEKNSLTAAAAH